MTACFTKLTLAKVIRLAKSFFTNSLSVLKIFPYDETEKIALLLICILLVDRYMPAQQAAILEQSKAPIRLVEANYEISAGLTKADLKVWNFAWTLRNVSNKQIRAWGILWSIVDKYNHTHEIPFYGDNTLPSSNGLAPQHTSITSTTISEFSETTDIKNVSVRVEFADAYDGWVWNPRNSAAYETILSNRATIEPERLRLINLYQIGGANALTSDVEEKVRVSGILEKIGSRKTDIDQREWLIFAFRVQVLQYLRKQGIEGLKARLGL